MQGSARKDVVFGQRGCILSPYQGQNGNPGSYRLLNVRGSVWNFEAISSPVCLGDQFVDDLAAGLGELFEASAVEVRQLAVVQAEKVQ